MKLRNIVIAALAAFALTANAFAAVTYGTVGRVSNITRRVDNSYFDLQVGIDEDNNGDAERHYYSGGTWCEGVNKLTDSQIEAIEQAALNDLIVAPGYEIGPRGWRCLTYVTIHYRY
ncbi:MAG TPA: hypothetical protein VM261_25575 [Kofleriaceae bacterium]|nr:hypothetical protein [Kofleriaceae bacterium]